MSRRDEFHESPIYRRNFLIWGLVELVPPIAAAIFAMRAVCAGN